MNQTQRNYAVERINELANSKIKEVEKRFTTPEKRLKTSQKFDLIYSGKVNLLPRSKIDSYVNLRDAFDFSKFENKEVKDPKADDVICKINLARRDAKDAIILSDDAEALRAIKNFESIINKI
jgi:hypothetical protein